jgi:hypothetical protein
MFSGLILAHPQHIQGSKKGIKKILRKIELETLQTTRPLRHPSISLESSGASIGLYKKERGTTQYLGNMNPVGKTVWEACDGNNTPLEISNRVHQKYLVSPHQAYLDCICFLAVLRSKGAIQI